MILSDIYKYQKPIILYGDIENIYDDLDIENKYLCTSYENIDYAYYPIIISNEPIAYIKKGIILTKQKDSRYLSLYIENNQISFSRAAEYWIAKPFQNQFYNFNIHEAFEITLHNLKKFFTNKDLYIHAYEQVLKLYYISQEKYFNQSKIISLLSCALLKKKVELIDIDMLYIL